MGNASTREKGRHVSGEDQGPTMKLTHEEILDQASISRQVSSPMEDIQIFNTKSKDIIRSDMCASMRPESLVMGVELNSKKLPTVFKWDGGGKDVTISGSFDNWTRQIPMVKSQGDFYTIIDLPEGTHQYKFYVDGQWVCDKNANTIENEVGSKNNSMMVKGSDFEVFEALAIDSHASALTNSNSTSGDISGSSPPGEYSQNIPPRSSSGGFHQSGPPILPPHLLQVILNKEVPQHCEPTLLPEPNHVMLNHLYALSIKDGVMVLSATVRYRKKYVTTLLYKPI